MVFLAGLLLLVAVSNLWVYRRLQSALDEDLGRRLHAIASILVSSDIVNGDALYSDGEGLDPTELAVIDLQLQRIQERNDLDTILLLDADAYVVRYSSSADLYEIGQPYPHLATHLAAILSAVEGIPSASPTIRVGESRGGVYLKSGFAPVLPLLGDEPVAILVVEASPDFFEVLRLVRGTMLTATLAVAGLLLALTAVYVGMQRQVRKAQMALERDNRLAALGRLASQVAHEIRNPVSIIKYSSERMGKWLDAQHGGRRSLDPELREMISYIEEETARLHGLTDRYLSYTRQGEPRMQAIRAATLVGNAETALSRMGLPDAIRVSSELHDDLPSFRGDPDLLRQALLNLGTNAVEAMGGAGEIVLFARTESRSRGGAVLLIGADDTGPGIPVRERSRVLEPLYSLREGGTGLGLYLVQQIALAHGGELHIENAPGGGARVYLAIPIEDHSFLRSDGEAGRHQETGRE